MRHVVSGFANSGAEKAVSLLALVCYFVGGYYADDATADSAGVAGGLAGMGVACLGLALSLAIWAVRRDGSWLTGERGKHPGVVLTGPFIFGAIFGALGGLWARRRRLSAPPNV